MSGFGNHWGLTLRELEGCGRLSLFLLEGQHSVPICLRPSAEATVYKAPELCMEIYWLTSACARGAGIDKESPPGEEGTIFLVLPQPSWLDICRSQFWHSPLNYASTACPTPAFPCRFSPSNPLAPAPPPKPYPSEVSPTLGEGRS